MSSLLTHLSPLAPDDSGACAVLYELGGITVVCDAGGCAGNVCGFDEPRWHEKKSALFSAGLRDMDAIFGRDKLLIDKLCQITEHVPAAFTAIVGTPVPAVIATDFQALRRMAEKRTGLPCIVIPTDGTRFYDYGAELAYYEIFDCFAVEQYPTKSGKIGIIGATPLDTGCTNAHEIINSMQYNEVVCFGMDSELDEIRRASECERVQVLAPCGLKAANLLKKRFGIPYEVKAWIPDEIIQNIPEFYDKKALIVHQQFAANQLRMLLKTTGNVSGTASEIDCATWFYFDQKFAEENDFQIRSEQDFRQAAKQYDIIFADKMLRRAAPDFSGKWIDYPHETVSGSIR